MTVLGRGKRPASTKTTEKDGERTDRAAEQAAKAEEAAEAARLAEEAAAKAREAARLAKLAADEAAAEVEETDAEDSADEDPADEEAASSAEKPRKDQDAAETTSEADDPAADDSAASEAPSADPEDDSEDAEDDEDDEPTAPVKTRAVKRNKPAAEDAEDAEDDEDTGSRFGAGGLTTVIAILAVLVIAFGVGTTVLALKVREQNATETASKDGAAAASRAAQKLSSYDYQTLDADLKAASATTTGKLRTQYDKLAGELRNVAVQQQAVSTTTVIKVGVTSATPDKVVALVYANRSAATKNDKQQRLPEPLRIRMTMVNKDGKWLASELTVIS